jgi:hypothetical protein
MEIHLKTKKHLLNVYELNPQSSGLNLCEILNMDDDEDDEDDEVDDTPDRYEVNMGLEYYRR